MTREEKFAEAKKLRAKGLLYREIAERLGVAKTTVGTWFWLEKPENREKDRAMARAWKANQCQAKCIDCGSKLAYDRQENERCQPCDVELRFGERNRRIFEAWENGDTAPVIGEREGMSATAVSSLVEHHRRLYGKLSLHRERDRHRWDEIEVLWREGLTAREIGERVGLGKNDVQARVQHMREAGIEMEARVFKHDYDEIERLYKEGLPVAEIGEATGLHPSNVGTIISRLRKRGHDIPYRNRPVAA